MEIYAQTKGLETVLFIVPEDSCEARAIRELARVGEPLKASIKKDVFYKKPHIEIRKETL